MKIDLAKGPVFANDPETVGNRTTLEWQSLSGDVPNENPKVDKIHNLCHIFVNQWIKEEGNRFHLEVENRIVDMVCAFF